ncbi:hypothetical protein D3C72_1931330 [compost metagenome]
MALHQQLHAHHQFKKVEGLADVVLRARAQALDAVRRLVDGGQDDDGRVRAALQAPQHLDAVDAGQHAVEHGDVKHLPVQRNERLLARIDRHALMAAGLELAGQPVAHFAVVLD